MKQTFFLSDPTTRRPKLLPSAVFPSASSWENLILNLRAEPYISSYPLEFHQSQWKKGLAGIVLHAGEIILLNEVKHVYEPTIRQKIASRLNISLKQLPDIKITKGVNGWVHPDWRRRGLYTKARQSLLQPLLDGGNLHIASTAGLGAVPNWVKLDWKMLTWKDYPFLSALEGWYDDYDDQGRAHQFLNPGIGWEAFAPLIPWNGKAVSPFEDTRHDFDAYAYFGASDEGIAQQMEEAFAKCCNRDLIRWRSCIQQIMLEK